MLKNYKKTSLLEAIGTALRCLQSIDITQNIERSKCKLLLIGGVSLAFILDKKLFQDKLNTKNELSSGETKLVKQRCSDCPKKVVCNSQAVECKH